MKLQKLRRKYMRPRSCSRWNAEKMYGFPHTIAFRGPWSSVANAKRSTHSTVKSATLHASTVSKKTARPATVPHAMTVPYSSGWTMRHATFRRITAVTKPSKYLPYIDCPSRKFRTPSLTESGTALPAAVLPNIRPMNDGGVRSMLSDDVAPYEDRSLTRGLDSPAILHV
jgi:hypothetical protein